MKPQGRSGQVTEFRTCNFCGNEKTMLNWDYRIKENDYSEWICEDCIRSLAVRSVLIMLKKEIVTEFRKANR
jgi:hypothetical protein